MLYFCNSRTCLWNEYPAGRIWGLSTFLIMNKIEFLWKVLIQFKKKSQAYAAIVRILSRIFCLLGRRKLPGLKYPWSRFVSSFLLCICLSHNCEYWSFRVNQNYCRNSKKIVNPKYKNVYSINLSLLGNLDIHFSYPKVSINFVYCINANLNNNQNR